MMAADSTPKVEFALGSEVSPGHFFKSDFARSFVTTTGARDSKSLDYEFYDAEDHRQQVHAGAAPSAAATPIGGLESGSSGNNNFYSLVNFGNNGLWTKGEQRTSSSRAVGPGVSAALSKLGVGGPIAGGGETALSSGSNSSELDKLRKKCELLAEENERLRNGGQHHHQSRMGVPGHVVPPSVAATATIDSVYLQNQVDTLQWQLKQCEANRQMYRSLMEQVARFLDRARKSLDILHEKAPPKARYNSAVLLEKVGSRVPRSRSVHTVHANDDDGRSGHSPVRSSCASSTTSSSSSSSTSSSSSRFARAKSVAQISANSTSVKDITWSVHKRKPQAPPPPTSSGAASPSPATMMSKSALDVTCSKEAASYRRPKQSEIDPDDVPPEKLSQEAFRLMRTVQSLLTMREPDLTRLSSSAEITGGDLSPTNFANSTSLLHHHHHHQDNLTTCSSSDRGSSSCTDDEANRTSVFLNGKHPTEMSSKTSSSTTLMSPGARQSIDSSSSKEEETVTPRSFAPSRRESGSLLTPLSSTPNRTRTKKVHDRKDLHFKTLRDWALGSTTTTATTTATGAINGSRSKPTTTTASVSSAEDESGFSSMSSFQEVGLPNVCVPCNLSPIKQSGCHTEVGLPDVPDKVVQHRRWSSTPSEFQALSKRRHSGSFTGSSTSTAPSPLATTESLSVWV